jgi:hypothetical protein
MSRYYRSILNVQQVAPALDPDAEAFLLAAGITDATITSAIDNLVLSLKADSIWTKMTALYPFVGGTASTHKFNLKDPRDLDAAFRLTFVGSPTHDANGMQGNGSSQYANTHLISGDYTNDFGYGVYSNSFTTGTFCHGATGVAGGARTELFPRLSSGGVNTFTAIGTGSYTTIAASASGLSSAYRNVNTHYARVNKTEATRTDSSANYTSSKLFLMARNNTAASTVDFYSPDLLQFAYACDFLTKLEHDNFVDIINNFQIALSR